MRGDPPASRALILYQMFLRTTAPVSNLDTAIRAMPRISVESVRQALPPMSVLATSRVSFWNRVANSLKSPMKKSVVADRFLLRRGYQASGRC